VSSLARHYLLEAGVEVPRPGSHTLRHSPGRYVHFSFVEVDRDSIFVAG